MAITQTFDAAYPDHPWSGISTNQRMWYDPMLRDYYYSQAIFNRFSLIQFDTRGLPDADAMTVSKIVLPHGNFDPIGARQLWIDSSRVDTSARTISLQRYGRKMAFHKHDQAITYWQGDKYGGLERISQAGLNHMMVEIQDALARNALLSNPFAMYGSGTGVNFGDIDSFGERFSTGILDSIHLGMAYRNVPYASAPTGIAGNIICICSPGIYHDLVTEASENGNSNAFIDVMKYNNTVRIINSEVGTYHNVRFVRTPRATLFNCGPIEHQSPIKQAHLAGDGSDPTKLVDGVHRVGQPSGTTKFIKVADSSGFDVGDIVSLHIDRTSDFGVTDGADYRDGSKVERRIIYKDDATDTIVLDKPIMEDFNVDLGSSVYGYVTKARHIHTAIFLGGQDAIVQGVLQPPRIYTPDDLGVVDDFRSLFRFSFDMSVGHQLWNPDVSEVWYGAGSFRYQGNIQQ